MSHLESRHGYLVLFFRRVVLSRLWLRHAEQPNEAERNVVIAAVRLQTPEFVAGERAEFESPLVVRRLGSEDRRVGRPKPLQGRILDVEFGPVDPIERSVVELPIR